MSETSTRERYEALTGLQGNNLAAWLASLFGVNTKQLYRWDQAGWPRYTVVTVDLLEALPRKSWPKSVPNPYND